MRSVLKGWNFLGKIKEENLFFLRLIKPLRLPSICGGDRYNRRFIYGLEREKSRRQRRLYPARLLSDLREKGDNDATSGIII